MKNNKYAPYILGPILLLLWGTIFYKIYQAVYPSEPLLPIPNYTNLPLMEQPTTDSSFPLLLNYKDPFLNQLNISDYPTPPRDYTSPIRSSLNRTSPSQPSPTKNGPLIKKNMIPFPSIIYQGYQFSEGDTSALLKINGRFYPIAKIGQTIDSIELLHIGEDVIEVKWDTTIKTINKTNK